MTPRSGRDPSEWPMGVVLTSLYRDARLPDPPYDFAQPYEPAADPQRAITEKIWRDEILNWLLRLTLDVLAGGSFDPFAEIRAQLPLLPDVFPAARALDQPLTVGMASVMTDAARRLALSLGRDPGMARILATRDLLDVNPAGRDRHACVQTYPEQLEALIDRPLTHTYTAFGRLVDGFAPPADDRSGRAAGVERAVIASRDIIGGFQSVKDPASTLAASLLMHSDRFAAGPDFLPHLFERVEAADGWRVRLAGARHAGDLVIPADIHGELGLDASVRTVSDLSARIVADRRADPGGAERYLVARGEFIGPSRVVDARLYTCPTHARGHPLLGSPNDALMRVFGMMGRATYMRGPGWTNELTAGRSLAAIEGGLDAVRSLRCNDILPGRDYTARLAELGRFDEIVRAALGWPPAVALTPELPRIVAGSGRPARPGASQPGPAL